MEISSHVDTPTKSKEMVNAAAFASKFQSKREVWRFLSSEVGAYLASYETMTIYHLKEIASGKRKKILCTEIKHINVP